MTEYSTKSRYFEYRKGELFVENVPMRKIHMQYGTPTYVYSKAAILDAFEEYQRGLEGVPHLVAFAVKANGNVNILKMLAQRGAGADLTSGGELYLSLRAGIPGSRIVFSGVGKTDREISEALAAGILMFNIESEPELDNIAKLAGEEGLVAPISIRVNPNIDAKTHPKISTGLKEHKFGVAVERAMDLYRKAATIDSLEIAGISAHIGSSLMDEGPLLHALEKILEIKKQLEQEDISIKYLDIGGGLGIQYEYKAPTRPEDYAHQLKEKIKDKGVTLILEPGRSLVGNAAMLLCRVQYVKRSDDRTFLVVDAGMNGLARPAIYDAYHAIIPVQHRDGQMEQADIVGPVCESSDVFGKQRSLPASETGDLLAICSAGAYGFAMASHYNGRIKPAEVMVDGDTMAVIRERETYDDLCRNQVLD